MRTKKIHSKCNENQIHGASAGSKTNTVVAAGIVPSSTLLPGRLFLMAEAVKTSPGHDSS